MQGIEILMTGTMAPGPLEGPLGGRFRAATEDPAALARWLGPKAQQVLAGVEGLEEEILAV